MEQSNNYKTKVCKKCNKNKPFSEYYNNKNLKDGKAFYCKECATKIQKEARERKRIREYKLKQITQEKKTEEEENNNLEHTTMKTCYRCNETQPLCNFYKDKRQKDGYSKLCITCKKKREKENLLKRLEKRGY